MQQVAGSGQQPCGRTSPHATHCHDQQTTAKLICTVSQQVQAPCRHRQAAAKWWDALRGGSVRHLSNVQALLLRLLVHSQPAGLHSRLCNTSSRGWVDEWWVQQRCLAPVLSPTPSTQRLGSRTHGSRCTRLHLPCAGSRRAGRKERRSRRRCTAGPAAACPAAGRSLRRTHPSPPHSRRLPWCRSMAAAAGQGGKFERRNSTGCAGRACDQCACWAIAAQIDFMHNKMRADAKCLCCP